MPPIANTNTDDEVSPGVSFSDASLQARSIAGSIGRIRYYSGESVIGSSKKGRIYLEKEKYLNDLSFEDAEKLHGWLDNPENICNSNIHKAYKDNGFIVLYSKNTLQNDNINIEDFKKGIKLGSYQLKNFRGESFNPISGALTLQYNSIRFPEIEFIVSGKPNVGDIPLKKMTNGILAYWGSYMSIAKPESIRSVLVSYVNDTQSEPFICGFNVDYTPEKSDVFNCISSAWRKSCVRLVEVLRQHERITQIRNRHTTVHSKKHFSKNKKGIYIDHNIPFSCEVECYGKDKKTVAIVSNKLGDEIGMSHDASLTSGIGFPIEIQTPILFGKRGEICVANLCNTLIEHDFKIDKTCGLHIHLDGSGLGLREPSINSGKKRPKELISMYLFYRLFDSIIISFLPSTRRNNRYCASMDSIAEYNGRGIRPETISNSFEDMKSIKSLKMFMMYWYKTSDESQLVDIIRSRYTPTRYYGANFHSLLKDNHFEVRYHSGTLNYEKILYWIDLHGKILSKCISGEINENWLKCIKESGMDIDGMTQSLYLILRLNNDEIEYFDDRRQKFKDVVSSEEILIDKTKKSSVA